MADIKTKLSVFSISQGRQLLQASIHPIVSNHGFHRFRFERFCLQNLECGLSGSVSVAILPLWATYVITKEIQQTSKALDLLTDFRS